MDHRRELVVRDAVIPGLLRHLHAATDPWEFDPRFIHPTPNFVDVAAERSTCKSWREAIDSSMEAQALRLAHWNLLQDRAHEPVGRWISDQEFIQAHFVEACRLYSKSWQLVAPMEDARLRTLPLQQLTVLELGRLRDALQDDRNREIKVVRGDLLPLRANELWVTPALRM